jgi:hypothetical protein
MNSKQGIFFVVFALAMLIAMPSVHAQDNSLSLANIAITPQPIYSGSNVTIHFQLYNSYQNSLNNVDLWLQGSYPLLNYSPSTTTLIGSIGSGLYGGMNFNIFSYTLHIPQNVQAGTYTVDVVATYELITGPYGTSTPGESVIPISLYISGMPKISLNANPSTPIIPGQISPFVITGINTGTDTAENVSIDVLNNANFTVTGPSQFYLGTIPEQGVSSSTVNIEANNTIASGSHNISVVLHYNTLYGKSIAKNVSIKVNVVVNNPDIAASITGAIPQYLYSGSNQTLELSIQNTGTGIAKNVSVVIPSSSNITVGSSSSNFFASSILPGSQINENVFITANRNNNATFYELPVKFRYFNANYQNSTNTTQYLKISLQKSATFNVTSESGSIVPGASAAPITFVLRNNGNEEAQQISISLQSIYPISPTDSNFYLQQLAPGQSANVTFYVNVDSNGNSGSYPVTLYEQWNQPNGANNQQYAGYVNYYAYVGPVGSASSKSGLYTDVIIAIIVIIIVVYLARRMGGKKATKKIKEDSEEEDDSKQIHKKK